ncbi:MAG: ATP-binding protein [Dehalococcoidia bacterium]|nr:ATP-binding protein [Dehalococcoidia bacterium]
MEKPARGVMNGNAKVSQIDDAQLGRILAYDEGHFGDIKAIEVLPSKMSESVSAFANTDGGELWIGVDEDEKTRARSWRGFARVEDANSHLQILNNICPLGSEYSFEFLEHPPSLGFVLHIEIKKTRSIIKATNGIPYLRLGAQKLPVDTPEKLTRLARNKGITSFETETVSVDPQIITNSATTIGFMLEVVPTSEPEPWLRKQMLIVDSLPTVAGIVLFADEPQSALPKRTGIKMTRFTSTGAEGTRETLAGDPVSVEGCAYDLIHRAVKMTQEIIGGIPRLGERGLEPVTYPPVTLHEIITNAVLHRDYSIPDDIHVRIFDNRVEVESPGLLPGHITEQNILNERFARNPTIVRLINRFLDPPNKDIGEGLNTAFAAMKMMRLRDPEIKQSANSVIVYIRHTRLASPEDAVLEYLSDHDQITNTIGRDLTGIRSDDTMKNVFTRLRQRGLVERVPNTRGRNSAWRKPVATGAD